MWSAALARRTTWYSSARLPSWTEAAWQAAVGTARGIWPAYLVAAGLILTGITWSLPDGHYQLASFQVDEDVAVWAVNQVSFPRFFPEWLSWGTGLFYQVYLLKTIVTGGGRIAVDDGMVLVLGRLVVLASALGTVTLVYLLGKTLFDAWTGRLAALILAVLPGFIVNSHYFKTDVPMTCWAMATLLAACVLLQRPRLSLAVLLGALAGYAASVKYSAAILVVVGLVTLVVAFRRSGRSAPWLFYLVAAFVGFAVGAPYALLKPRLTLQALQFVAEINSIGAPYAVARPPAIIDYAVNVLPYSLTVPVLLATAAALVFVVVKGGRKLLPIWAFLLLYVPLLATDNMRLVRYTVPLLPLAALFLAFGLRSAGRVPKLRLPVVLIGGGLVAYTFVFSLSYAQVMARTDPRTQAAAWIEQNIPHGAPIPAETASVVNIPQLKLIGYEPQMNDFNVDELSVAESPYLIMTDYPTQWYREAIDYYPRQRGFLEYVDAHYRQVAEFLNPQTLLGIDSRGSAHIPQDWLHPNPRITILQRVEPATE